MYKRSEFSGFLMDPNGVIFQSDASDPLWIEFSEWQALGNEPELVYAFPGEVEAEEKKQALYQESSKYQFEREPDGKKLYYDAMALLRYDLQHGNITQNDFDAMQEALIPTRRELFAGQWDVALITFQGINLSQTLNDLYFEDIESKIIAYVAMTYSDLQSRISDNLDDDIGGGGIKNPKP